MSLDCCEDTGGESKFDHRYRRILWLAFFLNLFMFCVEVLGGVYSGSVALFADAMDFAADSVNYALSLLIFSLVLVWRSRLALLKGISMVVFGVWVLW